MLNPPGAKTSLIAIANGTTTGSTGGVLAPGSAKTYQATAIASSGTGNAVIAVQGSMTNSTGLYWDTIGTITLTSATTAGMSDGFTSQDRYTYVRGNITTLSSNISAGLSMGY